jgi:hypothetical protein
VPHPSPLAEAWPHHTLIQDASNTVLKLGTWPPMLAIYGTMNNIAFEDIQEKFLIEWHVSSIESKA